MAAKHLIEYRARFRSTFQSNQRYESARGGIIHEENGVFGLQSNETSIQSTIALAKVHNYDYISRLLYESKLKPSHRWDDPPSSTDTNHTTASDLCSPASLANFHGVEPDDKLHE